MIDSWKGKAGETQGVILALRLSWRIASCAKWNNMETSPSPNFRSHTMSHHVYKQLDLTRSSRDSIEDAVSTGIPTAHETGRNIRSEEHTSELQSRANLVGRRLLEKKNPPP